MGQQNAVTHVVAKVLLVFVEKVPHQAIPLLLATQILTSTFGNTWVSCWETSSAVRHTKDTSLQISQRRLG